MVLEANVAHRKHLTAREAEVNPQDGKSRDSQRKLLKAARDSCRCRKKDEDKSTRDPIHRRVGDYIEGLGLDKVKWGQENADHRRSVSMQDSENGFQ